MEKPGSLSKDEIKVTRDVVASSTPPLPSSLLDRVREDKKENYQKN